MIDAICKSCGHVFVAIVVLGLTACSKCGSKETAVALAEKKAMPG